MGIDAKVFWNRIKTMIKQKKTTQEMAAIACGISFNTWKGWVSKGILPGIEQCSFIAKFLDVSLDYLVMGKERNTAARIDEIRGLLQKIDNKLCRMK